MAKRSEREREREKQRTSECARARVSFLSVHACLRGWARVALYVQLCCVLSFVLALVPILSLVHDLVLVFDLLVLEVLFLF